MSICEGCGAKIERRHRCDECRLDRHCARRLRRKGFVVIRPGEQLTFDDLRTLYHRGDPETAKQAARRARRPAVAQRELCMTALHTARGQGATHDEIDELYNWPAGSANRRLGELREAQLITRTKRKRLTRRNSPARIYILPAHLLTNDEVD